MASFSVLLALSGFRYSAVERKVSFHPCIHPEDFRCFFAAGSAWGLYSQNTKAGVLTAKLECRHGELILRRLVLGGGATKTTFAKSTLTGPDGKQIRCSVKSLAGGHEIELSEELTMREGESATATLTR